MPCDGSTPIIETPWNALDDLRCDLAVTAPDIENLFPSLEIEQGELLLGHRLLEARLPGIVARVPFRPGISPVSVATPSRQTAPPDDDLGLRNHSTSLAWSTKIASVAS